MQKHCEKRAYCKRYINEMQGIIRPVSSSNMMQVDRNDIWWNMESIFRACDEVGILKINV
ncbi:MULTISPECIES: hypothetical protein [Clostridium]|uniref:Uncharacterized protein n=1 Tax=Clostridium frigoriphilum TaxID=443253 RepID=A0ABU7UVT0_9CLOT|nr:hypothetical protein [Clostridium sp. DSM 17811]MBU3102438.1 hypothetical protein [Clostridium sp. DSM 17811]